MSQLEDVRSGTKRWGWLRRPVWIFLVAFTLRITVAGVLLAHNQISWGVNEPGGIGCALVQGRGYASPFHDANGPTAWLAPIYPSLLAGLFRLFGIETAAAAVGAILINVIAASLTAVVVVQLGREQFGKLQELLPAGRGRWLPRCCTCLGSCGTRVFQG